MLFLGAGASKPFGVPTLQEFSKIVIEELNDIGYEDIINEIITSLENFEMIVDFESIYTILDAISKQSKIVKEAGLLTAYLLHDKTNLKKTPNIDTDLILKKMKEIIYEGCMIDSDTVTLITEHYDFLFKICEHEDARTKILFNGIAYTDLPLNKVIATTNYDMALEIYFLDKAKTYLDGFTPTDNPLIKNFDFNKVYQPFEQAKAREKILIKLHGSIWQFKQGNNLIKTIVAPNQAPIKIDVQNEMMIYPTKEKEILSWDYYHFFNMFKKMEWNRLMVIGHSFRDDPVNTTIVENMRNNPNAKLIVFNPDTTVIDNLGLDYPNNNVLQIDEKFGVPESKEKLENMIKWIN